MDELVVLVVEDEPEVRNAIVSDLTDAFESIRIDAAEDVDDALAAIDEIEAAGDRLGLVVADHRLPGRSGVDLLVQLNDSEDYSDVRKVLLTGQAGHADTIRAINDAGLDHYFTKPWDPAALVEVAVDQLTSYVLANGLDPLTYMRDLDKVRLTEAYAARGRAE